MLSTKDVIDKFEVSRATLHNWKTTKPKLYDCLFNSDEQYEKYRQVNIFLDTYIKTAKAKIFIFEELNYIVSLNIRIEDIKDIENIHLSYINTSIKRKKENNMFTLNIYKKLESLNLIEKYIFCDRLKILTLKIKSTKDERVNLMEHYFKEFLEL